MFASCNFNAEFSPFLQKVYFDLHDVIIRYILF